MKTTIHKTSIGKVCKKSKADKYFTELSIFAGHFELLVVDEYMLEYSSVTPFLGCSLDQFNIEYNGAFIALVHTQRHSTLSHQFTYIRDTAIFGTIKRDFLRSMCSKKKNQKGKIL